MTLFARQICILFMNSKTKHIIKLILFIIYLCAVLYIVLFADSMGRMHVYDAYRYNLVPFEEIKRYWQYLGNWNTRLGRIAFMNIYGNILVFFPFGIFLPWITKRNIGPILTLVYAIGFSLAIELSQLFLRIGSFDVDDLMLNTFGAFLGCVFYYFAHIIRKGRK